MKLNPDRIRRLMLAQLRAHDLATLSARCNDIVLRARVANRMARLAVRCGADPRQAQRMLDGQITALQTELHQLCQPTKS